MIKLPALLLMFTETQNEGNLQLHTLCIVKNLLEKNSKTTTTNIRWIENIIHKVASEKISHTKSKFNNLFEMIESMCIQLTTQMRVDEEIERAMTIVDNIIEQNPDKTLSGAGFTAGQRQYSSSRTPRQVNSSNRYGPSQQGSTQGQYQRSSSFTQQGTQQGQYQRPTHTQSGRIFDNQKKMTLNKITKDPS